MRYIATFLYAVIAGNHIQMYGRKTITLLGKKPNHYSSYGGWELQYNIFYFFYFKVTRTLMNTGFTCFSHCSTMIFLLVKSDVTGICWDFPAITRTNGCYAFLKRFEFSLLAVCDTQGFLAVFRFFVFQMRSERKMLSLFWWRHVFAIIPKATGI